MNKDSIARIPILHAEGLSERKIARQLGCSRSAVRYHLNKMRVKPHPQNYLSPYPPEDELKALFDSGMTSKQIAQKLGVNRHALTSHIRNVTSIKLKWGSPRQYPIIIPTKMSDIWAYILGLIVSDGCISQDQTLIFVQKDLEICEYVRDFLSPTRPIKSVRSYWRLAIHSKELCNLLLSYGITPAKTKTVRLPQTPNHFERHLLRGIFDGDGSVCIVCDGYNLRCDIATSSPHLRDALSRLYWKYGVHHTISKHPISETWYLRTYTENSLILYQLFYEGATTFLKRKKEVFDTFIRDYATREYPRLVMPHLI